MQINKSYYNFFFFFKILLVTNAYQLSSYYFYSCSLILQNIEIVIKWPNRWKWSLNTEKKKKIIICIQYSWYFMIYCLYINLPNNKMANQRQKIHSIPWVWHVIFALRRVPAILINIIAQDNAMLMS